MVRFATQWSQKQLSSRVDSLNDQINAIDKEADRIYQRAYESELASNSSKSYFTESEAKEWAKSTANDEKTDYLLNTNRAELARERYKLKKELNSISSGQNTLFG